MPAFYLFPGRKAAAVQVSFSTLLLFQQFIAVRFFACFSQCFYALVRMKEIT
jgi:hypothetical protein